MSQRTFTAMSVQQEATIKRLAEAWVEGEARAYLKAYVEVMTQLQEMKAKHMMVSIVNNLLARMRMHKLAVHGAAKELMAEMDHPRSRMFVMAAAVDVLLHNREPGIKVKSIPDWEDTLATAAG